MLKVAAFYKGVCFCHQTQDWPLERRELSVAYNMISLPVLGVFTQVLTHTGLFFEFNYVSQIPGKRK